MIRRLSIFVCATLLISAPLHASGHTSGVSLIQEVGEYTIDVGYNPVVLSDDENALFDFLFLRASSSVEYDHVWVRIRDNTSTILATGVARQAFGPTSLLYRFPHHGEMTLEASFRTAAGETIASAQFPLSIERGESSVPLWWYVLWAVGACFVFFAAWYVYIRRRFAVRI